jgi:hypothetical protein
MNSIEYDLANLGTTPAQVADNLTSLGIKGRRCKSRACPIFNYLESQGHCPLDVRTDIILYMEKGRHCPQIYELSLVIAQFIQQFDLREYPHLESKS